MRRLRIPAVILAAALVLLGSFFLPSYVSALKDRQTVDMLSEAEGMSGDFKTTTKLSMPERLSLVTSAGNIALETGKSLDINGAFQRALTGLKSFNTGGSMDFDFENCQLRKHAVAFYIDSSDPGKSLIIWNLFIEDKDSRAIMALVDDETGTLLSIYYEYNIIPVEYDKEMAPARAMKSGLAVEPEELVGAVKAYYGLETTAAEYQKYDYNVMFLLNMSDGEHNADITISISRGGFWFNH